MKKYKKYRLIDFLEDEKFRHWVLSGDSASGKEEWDQVLETYEAAVEAKLILESLDRHYNQYAMTPEEINEKLQLDISQYRDRASRDGQMSVLINHRKNVYWIGRAAAVLLLVIGIFYFLQWTNRPLEIYETGYGERLSIVLPDHSEIQLNSNSSLTWNRNWKKSGERTVHLEGEAFFDVENIDDLPFYVKTEDVSIHVIGTQFNVNNRRATTRVFLESGRVNVEIERQPDELIEMVPGEELVYEALQNKIEKSQVNVAEEISGWKEGLLIFRDASMREVLKSISDIYGKEFVMQDSSLLSRNITTTIPLTNWEVSLTAVRLAMRLEAEEAGDTIRIKEKD